MLLSAFHPDVIECNDTTCVFLLLTHQSSMMDEAYARQVAQAVDKGYPETLTHILRQEMDHRQRPVAVAGDMSSHAVRDRHELVRERNRSTEHSHLAVII